MRIPFSLEACRDQPVGWIDQHEAPSRSVALVAGAGDTQLMMLFAFAKGESLHDRVDVELLEIQRNPALVRSFFRTKYVSYISD